MAGRRFARSETIHDKTALLEAMRAVRHEVTSATRGLRPFCDTFNELHLLTVAVDRLAGHLTGDPTLFHDKGSTGVSGMVNGVVMRRG